VAPQLPGLAQNSRSQCLPRLSKRQLIPVQIGLGLVLSDKLEPVSVFRGQAGLRQRSTRAIREERRRVAI
jgi:hypothetical protein